MTPRLAHDQMVLIALILLALPAPADAQRLVDRLAESMCLAPPTSHEAVDRLRASPDFPQILDSLALRCAEIALLFARFSVGSVDDWHPKTPLDFVRHTELEHLLTLEFGPDLAPLDVHSVYPGLD